MRVVVGAVGLGVVVALGLGGCKTLDKTLDVADGALDIANSRSVKNITSVVTSDDPKAAAKTIAKARGGGF